MQRLVPYNTICVIDGVTFEMYSLSNYDFRSNIDFEGHSAIYFFSKRLKCGLNEMERATFAYKHLVLYVGKTENARTRFVDHHIFQTTLPIQVDSIGICYCQDDDIDRFETMLLHRYNFQYNQVANSDDTNPTCIIPELQ